MVTGVKLSQIASGGSLNPSTDTVVAVRNGNTDVLVTTGGTPGGSQYDVQVNNGAGGFYGDGDFTYDYATGEVAFGVVSYDFGFQSIASSGGSSGINYIGDPNGNGNGNYLEVIDNDAFFGIEGRMAWYGGNIAIGVPNYNVGVFADSSVGNTIMGDPNDNGNGTNVSVSDSVKQVTIGGPIVSSTFAAGFKMDGVGDTTVIGDWGNVANSTSWGVDDSVQQIYAGGIGNSGFTMDYSAGTVAMGDINGYNNGTQVTIDDNPSTINFFAGSMSFDYVTFISYDAFQYMDGSGSSIFSDKATIYYPPPSYGVTGTALADANDLYYPNGNQLADSGGNLYLGGGRLASGGSTVISGTALYLNGAVYDFNGSTGSNPNILFSTGSSAIWDSPVAGGVPATVGSNTALLGRTGAVSSISTVTSPNDAYAHLYNVSGYITVTAISANTVTLQVTYMDESHTSRTQSFSPAATTTGTSQYSPITICVLPNTSIVLSTTVTGVGSQTYNVGGYIQQIT